MSSTLSPREYEVMRLVAEGLTNAEIAARVGRTQGTVTAQISTSMQRLHARNRAHAVALLDTRYGIRWRLP